MRRYPDHEQRFYYGAGAARPKVPGEMALHTWTTGPDGCVLEVNVGIKRADIGKVEVMNVQHDGLKKWTVVFDESKNERKEIPYGTTWP